MSSLGKRPREDVSNETSRSRKRPGGAARISKAEADAVLQRQQQRAEEARQAAQTRGVEEVVRQHYNAVPQRGREWRKTDSRIKGLRSFNNWVKSTLIHKFSPSESRDNPLRILDIGCGKGGDLGKWQQAPQPLELYVGVDPAEISIEQARERYAQMRSGGGRGGRGGRGGHHRGRSQRTFDAEFFAEDAFTYSLGDIPIVRDIGFGAGDRWSPSGGFDVVSMMFCMHYAYETEAKAKGMLQNVACSLKKGGRFLGVIPNSDVIRSGVMRFHERKAKDPPPTPLQVNGSQKAEGETADKNTPISTEVPESGSSQPGPPSTKGKPSDLVNDGSPTAERVTNGDHALSSQEASTAINVLTEPPSHPDNSNGIGKADSPPQGDAPGQDASHGADRSNGEIHPPKDEPRAESQVAEWGNSIYRIRFPGDTPKDGIFRPPYGWKYSFFMEEAVEEVPEYVVPWEAFRGIAEDYNLELEYRKPFAEVWKEEKNHSIFGPLSERMGVRGRDAGPLLVSDEEMEAASFYHAFCFYKV